jgi:hypothetical protein
MSAADRSTGGDDLHFERIAANEALWKVRQGGPRGQLLGTIVEEAGQWRASTMVVGQLHQRRFADRDAAATWLLSMAPRRG